MKWLMALALPVVLGLAWLDLKRDQARSLAEFTDEQTLLAQSFATTLRLAGGDRGRLLAELPQTPLMRCLVWDGRRALELGGSFELSNDEVRALIDRLSRGEAGAQTLSRSGAAALGLDPRMAVAGIAHVGDGWSIAVVSSAQRVRDRARVGTWRLIAATIVTALLVGLFGFVVTREQRKSLELEQALERSEATRKLARAERLATIGTLAAGVAHEVGTPLGIISGRAEQALSRATDDASKKSLSSILAQVDKVSSTIRQLLDFARVRRVEAGPVAAGAILETCRGLLEHRFRQAKVKLTLEVPPSLPPILGDAGQLEQVFVNLLINAADACSEGGTVRVIVSEREPLIHIEVRDDGCGILPSILPQVLDPFFTTKKRGQGTGLGLSIAFDIVRNHGGTLEIESAPGKGTNVMVDLPRAT